MKNDDIAIPDIPEIKTISPASSPRGTNVISARLCRRPVVQRLNFRIFYPAVLYRCRIAFNKL